MAGRNPGAEIGEDLHFFKHEEEAKGPEMAVRFRNLTDLR
jgi:hypothetical protein